MALDPQQVDYEAEGLLNGLAGESRNRRVRLMDYLLAEGATLDEIKQAAADDRLPILPVELFLRRGCERSLRQASEQAGLGLDIAQSNLAALRLPILDPDQPAFSQIEVDGFATTLVSLEAGLSYGAVLEIAAVFGQAFAQLADGLVEVLLRELGQQSPHPDEMALRLVAVAEQLLPVAAPALISTHRMHLRQRIAREVIAQAEFGQYPLPGARHVVIAFADLEGFTPLSERAPLDEVSSVATRFASVTARSVQPPVSLVKMTGDAAMLLAPEAEPLIDAVLDLCRDSDREGLPPIHAGVACGAAVSRLGDWFGRPVNLASRVTGQAQPGEVVATSEVREADGRPAWEPMGRRPLKGFTEQVPLFRLPAL